ncbi:zf-CCHC domain-containing protein [Cephalotus follicularis]|uniref:Zf-CCHC domain-containing protein n=1 Tax=Cephalotus follicularis TaxID=3775 RepID=A0A1Q3BTY5_CEPFO|nr:zf-CCHC domain-containing protein [Cephalotus follicularis]
MTDELSILKTDDDEEKEKRKKEIVALKSSTNEESKEGSDEELALITRKFKRFLVSKKKFGGKPNKKNHQKRESSKLEEIICFECNKHGHYKSDCPRLKKREQMQKNKAMLATWDDNDDSSFDEESYEEVAQLALMAIEEEEEDNVELSYDELVIIVEKYSSIISSLKKKIKCLTIENDQLKTISLTNEDKSKENESLKIEIDNLKKTFSNFSNSCEKLERLLGMQRCVFDKAGLGYDEMIMLSTIKISLKERKRLKKIRLRKKLLKRKISMLLVTIVVSMDIFLHLVFTRKMYCINQNLLELRKFGFLKEPL